MRGTLSFSETLELDTNPDLVSNPDGSALNSRTNLGFGLRSETRTEVFNFSLGAEVLGRLSDSSDDDLELKRQNASLNYRREGATSALTFSARHRETQLEDEVIAIDGGFFGISFGDDTLVISSGSVTSDSVGARLETGIGTPLELSFGTRFTRIDYQDTVDPELVDEERVKLDGLARFHLNRTLTLRGSAGYDRSEETASGDTTTDTYFGVGAETETARGLSITGDVFLDRSETESGTDDGIGFQVGMEQARVGGTVGLDVQSRIDESGRRTSATVSRNYELPTGALGFSVGLFDQEGDDTLRLSGGVDYALETPRGGLVASLTHGPVTSSGSAYTNTRLDVSYQEAINAVSGWEADVGYAATNEIGGDNDDSRASASLSYIRELNEDWDMRAGVEHTRIDEAGSSDRTRNKVFFTIGRDITFGF